MTKSNYEKSCSGTTRTINFGPHICDLCLWIDALLHSLWETKIFRKSQIEALWCPKSVPSSPICDRFVYWMWFECNGFSGPELVCGWSRDHKKTRYDIRLMTSHFFRNVSFACYCCIMANTTLKMTKSNYEKSWSGTTRTINFGPRICDLCLWIDALLNSLWETNIFRKSQIEALWCLKSVPSSAICDRFVYWMWFECNGINGPELVCGWSRDHKKTRYDIRLMTSHFFRNVSFAC